MVLRNYKVNMILNLVFLIFGRFSRINKHKLLKSLEMNKCIVKSKTGLIVFSESPCIL